MKFCQKANSEGNKSMVLCFFCPSMPAEFTLHTICLQVKEQREKSTSPPLPQHLRQNWLEKISQVTHKNQPLMTCMQCNKITFLRLLFIPTDMILQSLIVKANKEMTRTHAHKSHNLLLLLLLISILWFQKLGENSQIFCNVFPICT